MGKEHVGKGVNIALGPMMNIGRVPQGGRKLCTTLNRNSMILGGTLGLCETEKDGVGTRITAYRIHCQP
jgi:hypothetical protein